ncbi:acyltransferase [Neolewinella lacunae]|uniref:N-acetyltransferase n=1 Tax=Neolewinella lacunae TaxID=1517758 RepID=A0A923TCP1_9BACT|nr:acyltransferase [Neolewinella lacunae]MBC6993942.1 N-acetyltransferase [Neolewinella lacunae]MDN3634977.1 acyltransferase [Neolewinella lacunae]
MATIHPSAIVDSGARIGNNTRVWHFCHLMAGCEIGENCSLGQNVFVATGVRLGNNCKVQNNVSLYEGVTCGDDVFIGPSAVFTNVLNPRAAVNRRDEYRPTLLEDGVTIGANAVIVCGVRLAHHAFVGAGSVVTKDVAPFALVVGNPARQIGWMSVAGGRLHFNEAGRAICPVTQQVYRLDGDKVFRHIDPDHPFPKKN